MGFPEDPGGTRRQGRGIARPARLTFNRYAGSVLITVSVLIVLHGFWLSPRLTNQHVDQLAFWLPRWCFLGTNLAHGHIATWLPNQFAGVPFVSDPQSGWLSAPAMALFSTMSCARALGIFVTLQPILAGLGVYLFLRIEAVQRPAATVGGLTMALMIAGSAVALSVPFSGVLAWTALGVAATAGYLHAETIGRRFAWLAATELCLMQIAAAHLTDGVVLGGGTIGLYAVARSVAQVRAGQRRAGTAALMVVAMFAIFPLLAAAVLIPRLALLPRTSIGHGYAALDRLAHELSGTKTVPPLAEGGIGPWWGTAFARGPGGYAGALAILLLPVGLASRRWRLPVGAFMLAGLIAWVLNLDALITSPGVRSFALRWRLGELWLRDPYRFRYLLPLVLGILAGYAVQAWLDRPRPSRSPDLVRRAMWFAPSVAVFVALPLLWDSSPGSYVPLLLGSIVAVPVLLLAGKGTPWAERVLPAVTAIELVAIALASQGGPVPSPRPQGTAAANPGLGPAFPKLHRPTITPAAYLDRGPIALAIRTLGPQGRYVSFDPAIAADPDNPRGFLLFQRPRDWPAYENGRSILFGLDEVQGYSPVQLEPYWSLVRRVDRAAPIYYNAAHLQALPASVLRLFGVEWIIAPVAPPVTDDVVATEGRYNLYRLPGPAPRASVLFSWRTVQPREALSAVLDETFDPETEAVVAAGPARPPDPPADRTGTGTASYRQVSPNHVRVTVVTDGAGLLVVRDAFDRNWVATVDGREERVLLTDYLMQGIPVPAGSHVVELTYRDDAVGVGLLVSGLSWGGLIAASLIAATTARRRSSPRRSAPGVP
ncbi:MAG: YfhO family protein [Actinomycetota bacterium]